MMNGLGMVGGWMMIGWLIIIVVCIFMVINLINNNKNTNKEESPLDILKRKYAEGAISKDEFEIKKKDLA